MHRDFVVPDLPVYLFRIVGSKIYMKIYPMRRQPADFKATILKKRYVNSIRVSKLCCAPTAIRDFQADQLDKI